MSDGPNVVLVGVAGTWGAALAAALEREPGIGAVVALDHGDPGAPLRRAEALRVADVPAAVARVARAIRADVLVDARPLEQAGAVARLAEETGEALLAAGRGGVRRAVVLSSADVYGAGPGRPAFLEEQRDLPAAARGSGAGGGSARGRALLEVESAATRVRGVEVGEVAVLRAAEVLAADRPGPLGRLLGGGVVPVVPGIDPRIAVIGADDLLRAAVGAVRHGAPPALNVAADGVLSLGEITALAGGRTVPVLPAWGAGPVAAVLGRLGLAVPPELREVLRHGRGLDTRRLRDGPAPARRTAREVAASLAAGGPRALPAATGPRWEPELESFLRWSPNARPEAVAAGPADPSGLADLPADDLLAILPSLPPGALQAILRLEREGPGRPDVLDAIERLRA